MATIKDIAKRLNISVSTVSYALNGGPRNVPEHVKEQVWAVAQELDYRPNRVARQLVTRSSDTIGIVPDHSSEDAMLGPYLQQIFNAVLNVAERQMQDVLFLSSHSGSDPNTYLNTLLDGRVDGVILIADNRSKLRELLVNRKFPHVMVSAPNDGESPTFGVNNVSGMNMLVDHLADLGHKKVGYLRGLSRQPDSQFREAALLERAAMHGMEIRPEWVRDGDFYSETSHRVGLEILDQGEIPTAMICFNDESAVGFMNACRDRGLKIPEDISVVGFDNVPWIGYITPKLTTVRQPVGEIAHAAASALLDLIAGKTVTSQLFEPELIVRDSTTRPKEDTFSHAQK